MDIYMFNFNHYPYKGRYSSLADAVKGCNDITGSNIKEEDLIYAEDVEAPRWIAKDSMTFPHRIRFFKCTITIDDIVKELKKQDLIIEDNGHMYKVTEVMLEDGSVFFAKGDMIQ